MRPSKTTAVFVVMTAFVVSIASAGSVSDRLKNTMDKYQTVEVDVPERALPTAQGILQNIKNAIGDRQFTLRIPAIPFVSSLWRSRTNVTADKNSSSLAAENGVNSTAIPTKAGGQHPDNWCGGNILVDLNSRRELTYKSTQFPAGRSTPYACSWDVKVSKNCRRGRVTMRMDGRSRLASEQRCTKGYYRIAPFMKEAKICGRIGDVPAYQWYVDEQNPEEVSIIMKNIGLNDGHSEGLSFTLSGECLSDSAKATEAAMDNVDVNSRWMYRLLLDSAPGGLHSQVVVHTASMSFMPSSKLSAKASEKISSDLGQAQAESSTAASPDKKKKPSTDNKITFYSPLYLIFRKLNII